MKILLLIDKPNWAYHSIAKSLIKYNKCDNIQFDILPIKNGVDIIKKKYKSYDFYYVMGFQTYSKIEFLPKKRTMIGIHSCQAWDEKQTMPDKIVMPDNKLVDFLNGFYRVNAVSKYLYDIFKEAGISKLYYTPNGVDSEMFKPSGVDNDNLIVGFSGVGNKLKGVDEFIMPAIKKSKVQSCFAIRKTKKYVPIEQMPDFYNKLDVYICASSSEGMSLSVLEAAACGVPIISTRVGGNSEIIKNGENGIFADRSVDDISKKIDIMKDFEFRKFMSSNIRRDIVEHHCWCKKIKYWNNFFNGE